MNLCWTIGLYCRYIDEGVEGSDMGLFMIWGPLAEDSATKLKRCVLYNLYGILFSPLWLKIVPGCPAISVSS
jgi:hypothetical protein